MVKNNQIIINNIKKIDKNLFNKIISLKTNIQDFETYTDNLIHQENFKINVLFSDRTTTKIQNFLKKVEYDINQLLYDPYDYARDDLTSISCCILSQLLILKITLMILKSKMISSGNYINSYHNYYKSFPLTIFNDFDCKIIKLENKLNKSLIGVLNNV